MSAGTAELIDGRAIAAAIRREVADRVAEFAAQSGVRPGLATVLVGEDAASQVYVSNKRKACVAVGMADLHRSLPADASQAVVVGRSSLVGRPLASLLLHRNATVTVCHSRTKDLDRNCRDADILIAAVGQPHLLGANAVRPGATVIDVGIHRTPQGLTGDVDFAAVSRVVRRITPVPGGVGPMTIALLMKNTLEAALLQHRTSWRTS